MLWKETKGEATKKKWSLLSIILLEASVAGSSSVEEGQFKTVALKPNSLSSRLSEERDLWKEADRHLGYTYNLEEEITQVKS